MKTYATWGIEEMNSTIYVGPLRANSTKLGSIAFMVDIFNYTDAATKHHRAECRMIVEAVNEYNKRRATK